MSRPFSICCSFNMTEISVNMSDDESDFEPRSEDLLNLREWLRKTPYIVQDYDDHVLSAIVRACKGSLEKTKKALEQFNSLGQRYPRIIKNYDPLDPLLVNHLSQALVFTLPKKTPDGSVVYFAAIRHYEGFQAENDKCHIFQIYRYWLLSLYIYLWKNEFGSGKWIMIGDCAGMGLGHCRDLTPSLMREAVDIMQSGLPIRLRAVHMINIPPLLENTFNFMKSLLSKKLRDRVHFHSTMATFYELFPRDILPKEQGGKEDSTLILHDRWFKTVQSFRIKLLREESKMRRLDPLRPKTDDIDDMSVGSIRALEVD